MLVTQSIQIRGLTAEQYEILRYQCRLAKNMYNVRLYKDMGLITLNKKNPTPV